MLCHDMCDGSPCKARLFLTIPHHKTRAIQMSDERIKEEIARIIREIGMGTAYEVWLILSKVPSVKQQSKRAVTTILLELEEEGRVTVQEHKAGRAHFYYLFLNRQPRGPDET